ncbi:MAG: TonB-dependent receptor, partial [Cellvibrionaceae bacterium]|nr:TonB-dependent receptor [Cellvibrionaceae bacterium]
QLGLPKNKVSQDLKGEDAIDEGEIANINANIEWDLSDSMSLTSITGWKTYNFYYLEDYDARPELIDNFFLDTDIDYFSQELRLNFEASDSLVGFLGASYYNESIDAHTGTIANENDLCNAIGRTDADDFDGPVSGGCADPNFLRYWLDAEPTAADIAEATALAQDYKSEDIFNKVEADGWAVFLDLTWTPIDDLDLMYGVRYTRDTKEMGIKVLDSGGYLGNNFNFEYSIPDFVYDETTWSDTTQRIAANWQLSDEISLYANYGQGYKSGGYTTYGAVLVDNDEDGVADAGTKPEAFAPETVDSFEIGVKAKLLENTLQANFALYSYVYEDLQLSYFDNGATKVENLGEAEGQGFELDVRYLPNENLDLFFTYSYQDTEISDQTGVVGTACNAACKGNQLPFSPKRSASMVATYTVPLDNAELFATVEHFYQGKQYSDLDNNDYIAQQSHHETNLRFGYDSEQQWQAVIWIENLFSEEYFERGWANADLDNAYGYGITNTQVWVSKPRTVGIEFSYDF